MIKVHDNRTTLEMRLDDIEIGRFFMVNEILYRRCWYEMETFDCIAYEPDTVVCMKIETGELVLWPCNKYVSPINDRQIEFVVED